VTILGVNNSHTREISARTIDFAQVFYFCSMNVDAYTCNAVTGMPQLRDIENGATGDYYTVYNCQTQNIYLIIMYDTGWLFLRKTLCCYLEKYWRFRWYTFIYTIRRCRDNISFALSTFFFFKKYFSWFLSLSIVKDFFLLFIS